MSGLGKLSLSTYACGSEEISLNLVQAAESQSSTPAMPYPSRKKDNRHDVAIAKTHCIKAKRITKPKRPLNAYNFFFRAERPKILTAMYVSNTAKKSAPKDSKNILFAKVGRELSMKWSSLSQSELAKYKDLAAKDLERYHDEKKLWDAYQHDESAKSSVYVSAATAPSSDITSRELAPEAENLTPEKFQQQPQLPQNPPRQEDMIAPSVMAASPHSIISSFPPTLIQHSLANSSTEAFPSSAGLQLSENDIIRQSVSFNWDMEGLSRAYIQQLVQRQIQPLSTQAPKQPLHGCETSNPVTAWSDPSIPCTFTPSSHLCTRAFPSLSQSSLLQRLLMEEYPSASRRSYHEMMQMPNMDISTIFQDTNSLLQNRRPPLQLGHPQQQSVAAGSDIRALLHMYCMQGQQQQIQQQLQQQRQRLQPPDVARYFRVQMHRPEFSLLPSQLTENMFINQQQGFPPTPDPSSSHQ